MMFDININTSLTKTKRGPQSVDEMKTQSIKSANSSLIELHLPCSTIIVCKNSKKHSQFVNSAFCAEAHARAQNADFADFSPLIHNRVKFDDVD